MTETTETPQITYGEMVQNLAKPGEAILATLDPLKCHLMHMTFGIVGEIAELLEAGDLDHFLEEAGDMEFYLEGMRQGLGVDRIDVLSAGEFKIEVTKSSLITAFGGELIDQIKKYFCYDEDLNIEAVMGALCGIEEQLDSYRDYRKVTWQQTLDANMSKLLTADDARYSSGSYSDQQAQDRSDKAEEPDVTNTGSNIVEETVAAANALETAGELDSESPPMSLGSVDGVTAEDQQTP